MKPHLSFSPRRREQRRHLKQTLATNNLVPCLVFLLISLGPSIVDLARSTFGGLDTSAVQAPAPMRRPYGMTPTMFRAHVLASNEAGVNPRRVTQTIGRAKASAGYHAKDGELRECQETACGTYNYSAAVDLSVRGLSTIQIRRLVVRLHERGYVAWFRDWKGNRHIHMVYAGLRMKPQLKAQVRDGLHGRSGLVGHKRETFYVMTKAQANQLRALYLKANPL